MYVCSSNVLILKNDIFVFLNGDIIDHLTVRKLLGVCVCVGKKGSGVPELKCVSQDLIYESNCDLANCFGILIC